MAVKFTVLAAMIGGAAASLRMFGGLFVWLRASAAANLAMLNGIFGGVIATMKVMTIEAGIASGPF
jgi:hypothetical protein